MKTAIVLTSIALFIDTCGTTTQQLLGAGVVLVGYVVYKFIDGLCTPNN